MSIHFRRAPYPKGLQNNEMLVFQTFLIGRFCTISPRRFYSNDGFLLKL